MEPEVRYCMTTDGVRIAYTVTGSGPPIVVCVDPIASHVQLEWSHSVISRIQTTMARNNTLVRFDLRGSGLSDRVLPQTLEDWVLDIEAVVQTTGLREFAMTGMQTATLPTIAFASQHPDMVSRLAFFDGFARIGDLLKTPPIRALITAAGIDWVMATEATGAPSFGVGNEESRNHGAFVRACIDPEYLTEIGERSGTWEVAELARTISIPSLVIRHAGIDYVTMEMAKDLAARIPGAQLAIIEGAWADDPEGLARRVISFLSPGVEHAPVAVPNLPPSGTAIILFADIVDSTALTETLGDAAFREKARSLDTSMREIIRQHSGTPIDGKLLGDGVLAVFTSARQAIEAAIACARAGDVALPLHLGLHAGDVIREDNNVYGGAVNIASRISGLSAPGEVLVSRTVADLARTSAGVTFEDRGEHSLKGVAEPQRVFAVRTA